MRVRISYGTDIENVPSELKKLFSSTLEETHKISKNFQRIQESLDEEEIQSAINLMDKLRFALADIDNRIADISNIATGYVQYKRNEGVHNVEQGRPGMDTTEERPPDRDAKQSTGNPHTAGA